MIAFLLGKIMMYGTFPWMMNNLEPADSNLD